MIAPDILFGAWGLWSIAGPIVCTITGARIARTAREEGFEQAAGQAPRTGLQDDIRAPWYPPEPAAGPQWLEPDPGPPPRPPARSPRHAAPAAASDDRGRRYPPV